MVAAAYPILQPGNREENQFALAMRWAAYARRQPEPNELYFWSYWLDGCKAWLGRQGYSGGVTLRPFTAALVASGVSYAPLLRYPHDLAFGLALGEISEPSAAWRDVLRDGVPKPTESRRRVPAQPQQLNMVQSRW